MQLLDAEREARQRKKRRRNAQQVQAELRMYARYVNEERLTPTDHPPTVFSSPAGGGGARRAEGVYIRAPILFADRSAPLSMWLCVTHKL